MSLQVEQLEHNMAKLTIEVSAEELEGALQKAYQKQKGRINVPGFRKGKVPRQLIEKMYGPEIFYDDAANALIPEAYSKAYDESGLEIVSQPKIDVTQIEKGKPFIFTAEVATKPEVELGEYKGIEVPKYSNRVTQKEIDAKLEEEQLKNARTITVEGRPVQDKDEVVLDFEGFVDGEAFEGGKGENYPLTIGSGSFIPGFEEQLIGVEPGGEKDVKVTFPEEYHSEELAGKEAVFKCKVHEVKEEELPELNDDFAKDISECDTLEELKKKTEEDMKKAAVSRAESQMKNAVLEKVYHANDIEIPSVMVEDEISNMMNEFDQQLRSQGMQLNQYLEYLGKEPKDFRDELKDEAYKKVKTRMLVSAVADAEDLQASKEDVDKEIELMAIQYKLDADKIREMLGDVNMGYMEKDIRIRKAVDFMYDQAVIK